MNGEPRPRNGRKVTVASLPAHLDRIDARSPSEYAEDHLPLASNHPVLDDAERARIGTLYTQVSAFDARREGAALIARNIASMVETAFALMPRDWAPLVYCWRGGMRSNALTHILNEIGWRAVQLDGGYRAWRRHVVDELAALPARFCYKVVCGLTGSGKSRLLNALAAAGAQVLDLESLANHRGSLLGDMPDVPQPAQKAFDTALVAAWESFDPARPVYVESESKRIGKLQVPDALLAAMRGAPCIRVETPQPLRVALLKEEYAHFLADPAALASRLDRLVPLHGKALVKRWNDAAAAGDWDALVGEFLALHYDPLYVRSIDRNFPRHADALVVAPGGVAPADFAELARNLETRAETRDVLALTGVAR